MGSPFSASQKNLSRGPWKQSFEIVAARLCCIDLNISFSQATDINGQVRFNLHEYYGHHRPRGNYPSDTWIITATFRGRIQKTTRSVHPNFSETGATIEFDLR